MDLQNKIALITGASRGIGQAIAIELGKKGATIIGTSTTDQGMNNINTLLAEHRITGCGMVFNVNDSIDILLEKIKKNFDFPEILVNNAGITRDNLILRMKQEEWNEVIQTNLNAIFKITQACIKPMIRKRWGRIINISSVVALTGNPGQTNYCAAKAGLIGFSKAVAREIASRNITVNVVAPGFIKTDMTQQLTQAQHNMLMEHVPLKRIGSPEEVAAAVAFLASDKAGYITGETLHVNGGVHME